MTTPLPPLREDAEDSRDTQPTSTSAAPTPPPIPRVPTNQRPPTRAQVQPVQTGAQRPVTARPNPAQATGTVRPVPATATGRPPGKARLRNQNPLYLPWWSVLAMLLIVMVAAFGLVGIVLYMGSNTPQQQATPIIRIITAQPTAPGLVAPVPTTAPLVQLQNSTPSGPLSLAGPTLPVVAFTTTPLPVTVGALVLVDGTGETQLNVRDQAGVQGTTILFRATDGTQFRIIGGPQQASGFTWWQVQSLTDAAQSGWAVSNYLLAQGTTP